MPANRLSSTRLPRFRAQWRALSVAAYLGALTGCLAVPSPQLASLPPIAAGAARVWFYRDFFPEDTMSAPAIAMNGGYIGTGTPGVSFFRDVPAGRYHITVDSYGQDLYQFQDVGLVPGQVAFVKIQSLPSWEETNRSGFTRGTYYVAVVSPQLAALELAQTHYAGGG